jgi:FkbM family methyltransferase
MTTFFRRAAILWRRRQHARVFGFRFRRAAGFALPSEIRMRSNKLRLNLPADGGTRTAFIDVLLDDCYRLCELPHNIRTVVDIGCHAGLFSIAARHRWPQATIHSYEPNPDLKSYFSYHASQASFSVYLEAVGPITGRVTLIPNADSVQVRTTAAADGEIPQVSFGEVLRRIGDNIDLVKLDCEGAEWALLQDQEPWSRVQFLTMEFHLWAGATAWKN